MPQPIIVSAARTAIGRSFKGSLANTAPEEMATTILEAVVERSGADPTSIDDVMFAESNYGGGDLARYAAVKLGMYGVPGQALNRHCAGSLAAVANAAAQVTAGMDRTVVAGGVQSLSMAPLMKVRIPGPQPEFEDMWIPPSHPETPDAPPRDMSITVGWNTAVAMGISRREMDEWALRSHQRAIAAIDDGKFVEEIVALKVAGADGVVTDFVIDEHPRRDASIERLESLAPLHPEIEGFSISAGNSSGINDAAAAVVVTSVEAATSDGLKVLGTVRAWAAAGVEPRDTGLGALKAIEKVLDRAHLSASDVTLWEINEAFASVPIAACREFGLDEELVNIYGSGCSLGHPIAASGARMITTLLYELNRRGGGIAVAAMCAGGGQGGAVVVEV